MPTVVLRNVTKQYGPKVVLDDISLEINTGERVGLVGANGVGKTTLFRLIAGEESADLGTVTRSRGLEVGLLPQEPRLESHRTLHQEVGRAFDDLLSQEQKLLDLAESMAQQHEGPELPQLMAEYDKLSARFEAAGGYSFQTRLNEILGGLGFSQDDHHLPISALSGGQKCRAALARLLLQDRQLLLLDEPTNHLDIDATRWLEKFLAGHHGGAVIISHDRYLLDRLVSKIIEVERQQIRVYPGSYSNYATSKQTLHLAQERQYAKDRDFIEKEQAFIARHMGKQRTREAKGRLKRLERRMAAGEFVQQAPTRQRKAKFDFGEISGGRSQILRCDDLAKSYDAKALFKNLTLEVASGDRLGITGPNGTGKTTLLRIILGQVEADEGQVTLFERTSLAYYDQEHIGLDPGRKLIEEVHQARPDLSEQQVRSFLGRFLFHGEDVFKPLGKLSGGEQSRVRLARLVMSEPRVLVLDEPTNHLDIPSREVLEAALAEYTGTIIVVSHDRYFLDRIANRLLVLERDRHTQFLGTYSEYVTELEVSRQAELQAADAGRVSKPGRRKRPARSTVRKPRSEYDGLSLDELEERIVAREGEVEGINQQFADNAVYRDPNAVTELHARLEALQNELGSLNEAWESRVAGLDD